MGRLEREDRVKRAKKLSVAARLTALLTMTAGLTYLASPAEACAASSISLRGFANPANLPNFYYTPEGAPGTFQVGGAIDPGSVSVSYSTPSGSPFPATPGSDYTQINGSFQFFNGPDDNTECKAVGREFDVPVTDDGGVDVGGVEKLIVDISVQGASTGVGDAPMYILDDDGPLRARLPEPPQASKSEGSQVKVPVLRGGSGSGSITWSASPTSDLSGATSGTVPFTGGLGIITLSIADDTVDEPNETVTVTLQGSGGASVQGDNTFSLTILDDDPPGGGGGDTETPLAKFHHPKHDARYAFDSYLANTIHLFVTERPEHRPSLIAQAQIALRKNLTSGNCRWWLSGSWTAAPCAGTEWITVTNHIPNFRPGEKDLFIYEAFPTLRPSVRTNTKNYTVFGRAFDTDGNESARRVGKNVNTFEIIRG